MLKVDDVLEILSIPLLGIIPESTDVLRASNLGSPVTLEQRIGAPARAYFDAVAPAQGRDHSGYRSGRAAGLLRQVLRKESGMNIFRLVRGRKRRHRRRASGCRSCSRMSAPSPDGIDLVAKLRDEILRVIQKHMAIDPDKVSVKMEPAQRRLDAGRRHRDRRRAGRFADERLIAAAPPTFERPASGTGGPVIRAFCCRAEAISIILGRALPPRRSTAGMTC